MGTIVLGHTPNGREIRLDEETQILSVQPKNDNYWLAIDLTGEALRAAARGSRGRGLQARSLRALLCAGLPRYRRAARSSSMMPCSAAMISSRSTRDLVKLRRSLKVFVGGL